MLSRGLSGADRGGYARGPDRHARGPGGTGERRRTCAWPGQAKRVQADMRMAQVDMRASQAEPAGAGGEWSISHESVGTERSISPESGGIERSISRRSHTGPTSGRSSAFRVRPRAEDVEDVWRMRRSGCWEDEQPTVGPRGS